MCCVPEQEDVMPDADRIDRIVREIDPEGTNAPLRAWAEATKRELGGDPFGPLDPRVVALAKSARIQVIVGHVSERLASENATLERLVGEGAQAIAAGLVYVGDQIGRQGAGGQPQMAKSVKVVAVTARTALLEVDGEQHQVFAGESLRVQGLADGEGVYKQALERIANLDESFGDAPTDDRMRDIAVGALAAGER